MSRLKRWLNMNRKKVNEDCSLREEYIQQLISDGMPPHLMDRHAQMLKENYKQLKLLDETDPETWLGYTAYDFFTEEEKRQFNPDGSLRPEYVEYARSIGISKGSLEEMERRKKIDVDNYNEVSARYAEQGVNFGEQQMQGKIADSKSYLQRRKQMEQDLRNFEDIDSLPFDKDTKY